MFHIEKHTFILAFGLNRGTKDEGKKKKKRRKKKQKKAFVDEYSKSKPLVSLDDLAYDEDPPPSLSGTHTRLGGNQHGGRYPPPYELFGLTDSGGPNRPSGKKKLWPRLKTAARPPDFEKNSLHLHSWRPLTHKSHIEWTSPSRSKIQYLCSLPLSEWAINLGFIVKVKPPINL